jgi:polar amino acid transport system permease protein
LPELLHIKIPIYTAGVLALSINSGAYVSEVIRSGIGAVSKGQFIAAKALSIPYAAMMKDIILPQAIKNILPSLVNEVVNLIKESAVIGVIGVAELMRRVHIVAAQQYNFFEPVCVAAVIYYIIILTIATIGKKIEKNLNDKNK